MTTDVTKCPVCAGPMNQEGADAEVAYYRCVACGHLATVKMKTDDNTAYALGRRELTGRVREGMIDWRLAQWDQLYADLQSFINRYSVAKYDVQLQMDLIACLTKGFNVMDAEKYKQCKIMYKQTERMYKNQLKMLKTQRDEAMAESVETYADLRKKYKACRNAYRNTKIMWKIAFSLLKKLAMPVS